MTIARGFAATAIFASIAVSAASTAWADTTMSGHYTKTETAANGNTVTDDWHFTPCGDGCADVTSAGAPPSQAHLVNGQWTMDQTGANVQCESNTVVPNANSIHYTWDPNTLTGTAQVTYTAPACGRPAGATHTDNIQLRQAP